MLLFLLTIGVAMYTTSLEPVSANYYGPDPNLNCCPTFEPSPMAKLIRTGDGTFAMYLVDVNTGAPIIYLPQINIPSYIQFPIEPKDLSLIQGMPVTFPQEYIIVPTVTTPENVNNPSNDSNVFTGSGSGYKSQVNLKVASISPNKNAKSISRTKPIYVTFNEKIKAHTNWSKVYVKNLKTGQKVKISKTVKNNTLYIKTSKMSSYTWYQVYIPTSALKGNKSSKLAKSYTWKFKTGK